MKLKLISFKICPFVQRSTITLIEKGIEFDIDYIDIKQPPEWFLAISPFAKVPLLCVDGPCQTLSPIQAENSQYSNSKNASSEQTGAVIFESAVIMEFLNEVFPPSMHPENPLQRAHNREWIEFNSTMNMQQHDLLAAKDKAAYEKSLALVEKSFRLIETQLKHSPYFNGDSFSLIDAAFAPTLQRYRLVEPMIQTGLFKHFPAINRWADNLLLRPSLARSVVEDFDDVYLNAVKKWDGYAATQIHESK